MIDNRDISVVVQGAVSPATKKCLLSIRKYLPNAVIILSTWEGSNTASLEINKLVLTKDPGSIISKQKKWYRSKNAFNNTNRQIVSTMAGLNAVTTKYAIKMRTDFALTSSGFLDYFDKYTVYKADGYRIFSKRVISLCLFTRNPRIKQGFPCFHPSDFVQFGITEDVKKLWDIPLINYEEANWFAGTNWLLSRYMSEQHIWVKALEKNGCIINFKDRSDNSLENIIATEQSLANNFVLLSYWQFGIKALKLPLSRWIVKGNWLSCYTFASWQQVYKTYCDDSIIIKRDWQKIVIKIAYIVGKPVRILLHLEKLWKLLKQKFTAMLRAL
jgi:WavE lipopolysaccharide synthesis